MFIYLLLASVLSEAVHYSLQSYGGKIQNLLDVRLEACAVGWFLIIQDIYALMTSLKVACGKRSGIL